MGGFVCQITTYYFTFAFFFLLYSMIPASKATPPRRRIAAHKVLFCTTSPVLTLDADFRLEPDPRLVFHSSDLKNHFQVRKNQVCCFQENCFRGCYFQESCFQVKSCCCFRWNYYCCYCYCCRSYQSLDHRMLLLLMSSNPVSRNTGCVPVPELIASIIGTNTCNGTYPSSRASGISSNVTSFG